MVADRYLALITAPGANSSTTPRGSLSLVGVDSVEGPSPAEGVLPARRACLASNSVRKMLAACQVVVAKGSTRSMNRPPRRHCHVDLCLALGAQLGLMHVFAIFYGFF